MSAIPPSLPAAGPRPKAKWPNVRIPDSETKVVSRTRQRVQSIDPAGKNVYQSYRDVVMAKASGTLDANKLQWRDPKTGKLFFLCYGKCAQ